MNQKIAITGLGSISSLGTEPDVIWKEYQSNRHFISIETIGDSNDFVSSLSADSKLLIDELRKENKNYKDLDDSVLFAIFASRKAVKQAGWSSENNFGINIGSSRGATTLFEKYHEGFLSNKKAETLSSPTTTLGNISSWVANDLKTQGPEISHSITCSTGLHSLLNGVAWIKSGMCDQFLVGGSEAALTPFTIAQMKALKVYSKEKNDAEYPCKALDVSKTKNTMVLGEGAAVICLEQETSKKALAYIVGIGYATETLSHHASISASANCFQQSMKMATKDCDLGDIDAVVMHAPGTIKGDSSELKAIKKVFGKKVPLLTSNKWKIGHTFGASGLLSLELAILILQNNQFIDAPLYVQERKTSIKKILVNAVGFGGNAVSVLLSV